MEHRLEALRLGADGDREPVVHTVFPGLVVHQLTRHVDNRGQLTEFFRSTWAGVSIHQWTALSLGVRTIRGPSVHRKHMDAVVVIAGTMQIGFRDLRSKSPKFRQSTELTLGALEPMLLFIPPGVMHTFYAATEPALVIVGNTNEYDPEDDIKCRWQDAGIDIAEGVVGTIDKRARLLEEVIALFSDLELTG